MKCNNHSQRKKRYSSNPMILSSYTPKGIRIPVTSVKGKCPRPLDDGGVCKRIIKRAALKLFFLLL